MNVLHDIFPAHISTLSTQTLAAPESHVPDTTPKRVFLLQDPPQLRVYVDSPQGPELAYQTLYDPDSVVSSYHGIAVRPLNAPTPETAITITKSAGCGCGSRLKNFRLPAATYSSAPDPSRAI